MKTYKDLLENVMDLDDKILYNFTDATSHLMTDNGVRPSKGPQEKCSLFFQNLIDVLSKLVKVILDFFTL